MSAPPSPSGEAGRRGPPWALIAVVLVPLAVRLAAAGSIHLTEDEAYYRLWSFAPALGYYDHPPMIAWWIAAGRDLAGDNPLGVRLFPILGCALTTLLVFDAARLAGAAEALAVRAAVFFSATLLIAAGGLLAVPDAPASLYWLAALDCALRARRGGATAWWLAAGLAGGLAVISKYSALFLAPGVLLWLLSERSGRAELRRSGPWLAAAIALGVFSLNVLWNAQHHWLTFAKQFGRVGAGAFSPMHLAEFIFGQIVLVNPLIAALAVRAPAHRGAPGLAAMLRPFLAISAPFALYLLIHSLHARVEGHWPAPLYPAIAICAAAGAEGAGAVWAKLRAAAPPFGFALAIAALAFVLLPARDLTLRADPALSMRGWRDFATSVETARQATGAAWIGAASYGLTAQLAGEKAMRAPVIELFERQRWQGLTFGSAPDMTRPGLIVDLPRRIDLALLRGCFATVRLAGFLRRGDGGGPFTLYETVRVMGPRRDVLSEGCEVGRQARRPNVSSSPAA
jgi:4-amino-4-deoxy-L-arabinose transferase-like glycosyltransferase